MGVIKAVKWWFAYYFGYSFLLVLLFGNVDETYSFAMILAVPHTYIKLKYGGLPQTYGIVKEKYRLYISNKEFNESLKAIETKNERLKIESQIIDEFKTTIEIDKVSLKHQMNKKEIIKIIENHLDKGIIKGEFNLVKDRFISSEYIKNRLLDRT